MTDALEKEIAERFRRDTADHTLTILRDDGLHRHLQFRGARRWAHWFDIVTWPGTLTIRGDINAAYVFSRDEDMFAFFRRHGNQRSINPHYWAEKLPDCGRSVKVYSEDVLREELEPRIAEYEAEYRLRCADYLEDKLKYDEAPESQRWPFGNVREPVEPKPVEEVRKLVAEFEADGLLASEDEARRLLSELESWGVLSDAWEWDLTDWDWSFLWACHAIVWGISQYDAEKARARRARRQRWAKTYLRTAA